MTKIAEAENREGEKFSIFVGLDKELVAQIKKYSMDETDIELQKNTGDRNRFGIGSYEDWYKKERTPFALVHKDSGNLAALIWFGPKPLGAKSTKFGKEKRYEIQNDWYTISFRSYPLFRGKGLMGDFSKFVIDLYQKKFPNIKFWVGTDRENNVFIKFISKLGFKTDEKNSDLPSGWLIMIKI